MKIEMKRRLQKTFFVFVAANIFNLAVVQASVVKQRTYNFKTVSAYFKCDPGVPNNGHNYPTPTMITFPTAYGTSGILGPSKIPLNNTEEAVIWDQSSQPCSAYNKLLKATGYIDGEAIQNFSTRIGRTGTGECFKTIREDLKIKIIGYELNGSSTMDQHMDDSDCQ